MAPRSGTDTMAAMFPMCRWLALALPLGLVACGHGKDAADRRFDELGSQILRLQADQDRLGERLGALEEAENARQESEARPDGAPSLRPRLRVVKVSPESETNPDREAVAEDADTGAASRPVLRVVGQSATVQNLN